MNITVSKKNQDKWIPFNQVPRGIPFKTETCGEQEHMMRIWPNLILYLNSDRSYPDSSAVEENRLCILLDHELIIKGEL